MRDVSKAIEDFSPQGEQPLDSELNRIIPWAGTSYGPQAFLGVIRGLAEAGFGAAARHVLGI
jgi:hypothetical protein